MSLKLTEHQDRYDECVKNRLAKEYDYFLAKCERGCIPVMPDLDPNRNGLDRFVACAHECGYILGMTATVKDRESTANMLNITFETKKFVSIPYGTNPKGVKSKGRIPPRIIPNTPNIPGFGIKLSLAGWRIFLDTKFSILQEKLDEGLSIERIYDLLNTPSNVVTYKGEVLILREACRRAKVNYWNFIRAQKGLSKNDRQQLFDKMIADNTKFSNVQVYSTDMQILYSYAKRNNISTADVLHDFILSLGNS